MRQSLQIFAPALAVLGLVFLLALSCQTTTDAPAPSTLGVTRAPGALGAPQASPTHYDPKAPCPEGQLPSDGVCVPAPVPSLPKGLSEKLHFTGLLRDPERPESWFRYRFGVPSTSNTRFRFPSRQAFVAGALEAALAISAPLPSDSVRLVRLSSQVGAATVVAVSPADAGFSGRTFGTIATLHHVRSASQEGAILIVLSHLGRIAPEVTPHLKLEDDAALGEALPLEDESRSELWVAAYRVRDPAKPVEWHLIPKVLQDANLFTPIDPRDAFPWL